MKVREVADSHAKGELPEAAVFSWESRTGVNPVFVATANAKENRIAVARLALGATAAVLGTLLTLLEFAIMFEYLDVSKSTLVPELGAAFSASLGLGPFGAIGGVVLIVYSIRAWHEANVSELLPQAKAFAAAWGDFVVWNRQVSVQLKGASMEQLRIAATEILWHAAALAHVAREDAESALEMKTKSSLYGHADQRKQEFDRKYETLSLLGFTVKDSDAYFEEGKAHTTSIRALLTE